MNIALKCAGVKTQSDSMSQNTRKALSRNQGTPTETPPSALVTSSKGLNPSPKRAVRDPKTGRGTTPVSLYRLCGVTFIPSCQLYLKSEICHVVFRTFQMSKLNLIRKTLKLVVLVFTKVNQGKPFFGWVVLLLE